MKELLTPFTFSNTNVQLLGHWVFKVLTGIKIARVWALHKVNICVGFGAVHGFRNTNKV